jgi:hypothetical protein
VELFFKAAAVRRLEDAIRVLETSRGFMVVLLSRQQKRLVFSSPGELSSLDLHSCNSPASMPDAWRIWIPVFVRNPSTRKN